MGWLRITVALALVATSYGFQGGHQPLVRPWLGSTSTPTSARALALRERRGTVLRAEPDDEIPQVVIDAEERSAPGRQIRVGIAGTVALFSSAAALLSEVPGMALPAPFDDQVLTAGIEGGLAVASLALIQVKDGE